MICTHDVDNVCSTEDALVVMGIQVRAHVTIKPTCLSTSSPGEVTIYMLPSASIVPDRPPKSYESDRRWCNIVGHITRNALVLRRYEVEENNIFFDMN